MTARRTLARLLPVVALLAVTGALIAILASAGSKSRSGGSVAASHSATSARLSRRRNRHASKPRPHVHRPALPRLVGQLVMAGMSGTTPSSELLARVRDGEVGGVILFGSNIASHAQVRAAIEMLQSEATRGGNPPLLISADQEGGSIRRFVDAPPVSPRSISTVDEATTQGRATGSFLHAEGVNVNLAPIADVSTRSDSFETLQGRGFSGSSDQVAQLATAFAVAMQQAGIAACAKHFPGVGSLGTDTDTHMGQVSLDSSALEDSLRPFQSLIRAGVRMVMLANAVYPGLDPGSPATFSSKIINDLLRRRLGFRGVVITDGLDSPPDLPGSSAGDRAVMAVRAGADMVLFAPEADGPEAHDALLRAAEAGQIPRAQLNAAYDRIVALKKAVAR